MIDTLFKQSIDRFWEKLAKVLFRLGLTPNQVTWLGLVLLLLACIAFLWHKNDFLFGITLAITFAFDALDGAVARLSNQQSLYGGYLDAVVDRYQEIFVLFTLAWVYDYWAATFLVLSGSLLISYNKARVALEMATENNSWPDLMERLERIIFICALLIFNHLVEKRYLGGEPLLYWGLWLMAVLVHITAVQRFLRARQLLMQEK